MSAPLVPCPGCRRHVRASEPSCPFCASSLPSDLAARAVPRAPRRLSRAALIAFTSTVSVGSVGCGSDHTGEPVDSGLSVAAYGAPIFDSAPPDTKTSTDAGAADAKSDASDASDDGDTGSTAGAYGLPPSDGGP